MKNHTVKRFTVLMLAFVLISIMTLSVSAVNTTSLYYSAECTAGTWHKEAAKALSSPTLDNPCGGDVGIWFYTGNTGLQNSFVRDSNRTVDIECWENDGLLGVDDWCRNYTGYFAIIEGIYRQASISAGSVNGNPVETDPAMSLYMKFKVNTVSGDTSTTVPSGVLYYQFWAN